MLNMFQYLTNFWGDKNDIKDKIMSKKSRIRVTLCPLVHV